MKRLLLLCLFLTSPSLLRGAETKQPNFIVMIADDVGCEDLGCYGHPKIRTLNLDRLASGGMKFDAAFLTCSSCSPSRCSIMTGRYPHSTGAAELHMPLPAEQVVFAGLLRKAGYFTAAAGKWHLGKAAEVHFDKVVEGGASGCENWLKTLQERPKDKPFFLWLAAIDAHRPYQAKTIPQPHKPEDVVVPPYLPDVLETRRDLALYYDEITRLDGHIGDVLKELEQQGIADNTVVVFMADNGRAFPRCKTTLYDSGVRTPFLVRWPAKVKAKSVCQSLVSSIDLAPTFLDLAGVPLSPTFQGKSFAKLLADPNTSIRDHVFAEHNWHDYQAHERSVRSKRFLYIRNSFPQLTGSPPADAVRSPTYQTMVTLDKEGKLSAEQRGCFLKPRSAEELYDVQSDPHCLKNLVEVKEYAPALATLRKILDEWIKETKDVVPAKPTPDRFDRVTGQPLR